MNLEKLSANKFPSAQLLEETVDKLLLECKPAADEDVLFQKILKLNNSFKAYDTGKDTLELYLQKAELGNLDEQVYACLNILFSLQKDAWAVKVGLPVENLVHPNIVFDMKYMLAGCLTPKALGWLAAVRVIKPAAINFYYSKARMTEQKFVEEIVQTMSMDNALLRSFLRILIGQADTNLADVRILLPTLKAFNFLYLINPSDAKALAYEMYGTGQGLPYSIHLASLRDEKREEFYEPLDVTDIIPAEDGMYETLNVLSFFVNKLSEEDKTLSKEMLLVLKNNDSQDIRFKEVEHLLEQEIYVRTNMVIATCLTLLVQKEAEALESKFPASHKYSHLVAMATLRCPAEIITVLCNTRSFMESSFMSSNYFSENENLNHLIIEELLRNGVIERYQTEGSTETPIISEWVRDYFFADWTLQTVETLVEYGYGSKVPTVVAIPWVREKFNISVEMPDSWVGQMWESLNKNEFYSAKSSNEKV